MKLRFASLNRRNGLLIALSLVTLFASSCKKNSSVEPEPDASANREINEWVVENMRYVYYWNQTIPDDSKLNFSQEPPEFFASLRNPADRFSWIAKADELEENLAGVSTSTGITISLVPFNCTSPEICDLFANVRSVVPGSPAAQAGVERGTIFIGVNGQRMNTENYMTVLDPYLKGQGFSINLATLSGNTLTPGNQSVALTATKIAEPSVQFKRVINTLSGRKVGYLFYNRFLNNRADEIFNVFQEFKAAGVNELVLDLRYNPGGGIAVAGVLAALIKQDYAPDQVFVNYNYNNILNAEIPLSQRSQSFAVLFPPVSARSDDEEAFAEIDAKVKAANLNLSKVYILGTGSSASASELVIHNLAPYMEVIHIGEQTMGKNEGSLTIKDERTPRQIDWAIQPIVVKLADKNGEGDYDTGLRPDYEVDEFSVLPFLPHGSEEDPLIAKALQLIDPSMAATTGIAKTMAAQKRQRLQGAGFKAFKPFQKDAKYFPVQLDGTIDKNRLKKILEP